MHWTIYLGVVAVMSVLSFVAMGWDKRRASKGGWRVPERRLHVLELLGGWPGSWAGQRVFRHKTRKRSYRLVFWAMAAAHVLAVAAWLGRGTLRGILG